MREPDLRSRALRAWRRITGVAKLLDEKDAHIRTLRERVKRHHGNVVELKGKQRQHRDAIRGIRRRELERTEGLRKRHDHFRQLAGESAALLRYRMFACEADALGDRLAADAYIAHGVSALPAADIVAHHHGGRVYCDAIEYPSFAKLAVPVSWHPVNVRLLDRAFDAYLAQCDGILTVGWALGKELEAYGPPVAVIPNYRYRDGLEGQAAQAKPTRLRKMCDAAPDDILVVSVSTVATGMEAVLEALGNLPKNVRLAQIGPVVPAAYDEAIKAKVAAMGLEDRVHFFDFFPYSELLEILAGADLGLIVRDPAILNNYISLPNRVFDLLFAGVPMCAGQMPDIVRIIEEHDVGAVADPLTSEGWTAAIQAVLDRAPDMRRNAFAAAADMTWESIEGPLFEALGAPQSVTIFGLKDLGANNRTLRIARSLEARGVAVKICSSGFKGDWPEDYPGEHVHLYSALAPRD